MLIKDYYYYYYSIHVHLTIIQRYDCSLLAQLKTFGRSLNWLWQHWNKALLCIFLFTSFSKRDLCFGLWYRPYESRAKASFCSFSPAINLNKSLQIPLLTLPFCVSAWVLQNRQHEGSRDLFVGPLTANEWACFHAWHPDSIPGSPLHC